MLYIHQYSQLAIKLVCIAICTISARSDIAKSLKG